MGINLTEQTKIWVLTRPNREKHGYWPDRTQRNMIVDQNMGINQNKQTKKLVLTKTNGSV